MPTIVAIITTIEINFSGKSVYVRINEKAAKSMKVIRYAIANPFKITIPLGYLVLHSFFLFVDCCFTTSILSFTFSLLAVWLGVKLGHDYVCRWFGKLACPLAGVMLVIIGVYNMLI
jgi:putative Mn2+ efflux pump MntP